MISVVRANKVLALKKERDAHIFKSFMWNGYEFDSDQVSQSRLHALQTSISLGVFPVAGMEWRLANNDWVTIYAADAPQIYIALQGHMQNAFIAFALGESFINAQTDADALSTLDVNDLFHSYLN
jgi:Domain of unknown function (DUF4376)